MGFPWALTSYSRSPPSRSLETAAFYWFSALAGENLVRHPHSLRWARVPPLCGPGQKGLIREMAPTRLKLPRDELRLASPCLVALALMIAPATAQSGPVAAGPAPTSASWPEVH